MSKIYNNYLDNLNKTIKFIKKFEASSIDNESSKLKEVFDQAYLNKLFDLHKYDLETQNKLKAKLFAKLTIYSGNLSFLAIQILAANTIMEKNNFKKKDYFFSKKCGVAINHLRASTTQVSAKKVNDGYLLNGVLTWCSGYNIFDHLLIGFHYNNKEYQAMGKFMTSSTFEIIDTPKTFVGQGLNTVNVKLSDFFIKEEDIVSKTEIGQYTKNKSLSKTVHYAIYGIIKGAIKELIDKDIKKYAKKELKIIKNSFLKSTDPLELDSLRIKLFTLTQDIITLGMIQNGGKSILVEKNLQRYYRELIMFNSNGLNSDIKELFKDSFINHTN